jgi:hypothetical protein
MGEEARMRRLLLLPVALPLLVLAALSAQARAATGTIDPQVGPVTGQVGTELSFFITDGGWSCPSVTLGLGA